MDEADAAVRKDLLLQMFRHARRILEVQIFRLFDERIDDEDLISLLHLPADDLVDAVPLGLGKHLRPDRFLARRHLIDDGDIEIPVYRHGQGSRNRGRGHDENIRDQSLFPQRRPLNNAEAMLLVDHHQSQAAEGDPFLDQGMGSDGDIDLAVLDAVLKFPFFRRLQPSGQEFDSSARVFRPDPQIPVVLFRQDFRRRHHRGLITVLTGDDHRRHGHHRFPGTDISLQQAIHAPDRRHVLFDFRDDALLGGGQCKGKQIRRISATISPPVRKGIPCSRTSPLFLKAMPSWKKKNSS